MRMMILPSSATSSSKILGCFTELLGEVGVTHDTCGGTELW